METVKYLLQAKGSAVWSVGLDDSVLTALQLMAEKNIGAVLVLEEGQIAGIMSERDYARKVILRDKSSRNTPVRDIMTSEVVCVRPEQTLTKCLALMTNKHIRHLPVVDQENNLLGLVSIGDVVKAVIEEQQILINHLEDYITGTAR